MCVHPCLRYLMGGDYGCDGEEIFPPVNRPDVTPVITVSPWALVPQQIMWNQINEKRMFFYFKHYHLDQG